MMKRYFKRSLCLLLTAIILLLPACGKSTSRNAEPSSATRAATSDETANRQAIIAPTAAPTVAPTSPSREAILSGGRSDPGNVNDASGFVLLSDVIPDIRLDIRYSTAHNFVGDPIDGYEEGIAPLTKEAAAALAEVANRLREKGYALKIYDAYRPQRAVDHFVAWANDWSDTRMKSEFYPELDKSSLFSQGYIAYYSGHSRGSTVDLTIVDAATGEDVDMGGSFDYFGERSHPFYSGITAEQKNNRMLLRNAMIEGGFVPADTEWWHFTLSGEPYPNTYFNFPVSSSSLT